MTPQSSLLSATEHSEERVRLWASLFGQHPSSLSPADRERRKVTFPLLTLTVSAWLMLIFRAQSVGLVGSCCLSASLVDAFSLASLQRLLTLNPPVMLALNWGLMLIAMMAPMLAGPVRYILKRSFARRRIRSVGLFVLGYISVWMLAGAFIIAAALMLGWLLPNPAATIGAGIVLTLLWQFSPLKQICLNRRHAQVSLAAFGAAADWDALKMGLVQGFWCVGSCWALMLLPELFTRGHLAAMAVVTLWFFAEHLDPHQPPSWRFRGLGGAKRFLLIKVQTLRARF